jgi:type III pantothenate kinase
MGNSRLKWAVFSENQLITGEPLWNEQLNQYSLRDCWQTLPSPRQLLIACVTANQWLEMVISVATDLWGGIEIVRLESKAQAYGVTTTYQPPEKLGVDRWLALLAARENYELPACIVDCGTALTVDLINESGYHLGGVISPGLTLMKQALARGTDALPFSSHHYPLTPANFTEAAIYSGVMWAALGLIEQVLAKQADVRTVILTGGDAPLMAQHLNRVCVVDADLVLSGLAIVADTELKGNTILPRL